MIPCRNAETISRELYHLSRPTPDPADVTTHLCGWQADNGREVLELPPDTELPIAVDDATSLRDALLALRDGDELLESEIDALITALLGSERVTVWDALPAKWRERVFPDTPFPDAEGDHWADDWVQPTGAHDAYAKDAWVWHNGVLWVSLYDANVYEPGVIGTWRDPFTRWPTWIQPPGAGFGYPVGFEVNHGNAKWRNTVDGNTFEPGISGWDLIVAVEAQWQDSGETVTQLLGAGVIGVTDTAPFSSGQSIRILGIESTVSSIFTPGAPGVLVVSPHIAVSGGESIEIFA